MKELPNFTCLPNASDGSPGPQHKGTIHFENHVDEIERAAAEVGGRGGGGAKLRAIVSVSAAAGASLALPLISAPILLFQAKRGIPATQPVVEMTIPSAVDGTLAPAGKHVVQLFVQYAPYDVDPKVAAATSALAWLVFVLPAPARVCLTRPRL